MLSLIVVAVPLLCVISFLLSPLIAIRRGYAPYYWMFACGPIGLVVITLLPPLKAARDPEEYERFGFEPSSWAPSLRGSSLQ